MSLLPEKRVILISMAFFRKEKKENLADSSSEKKSEAIKPHITEKAAAFNEKGVYVFRVARNFNKIMVKEAVKKIYGATSERVSIINVPSKTIFMKRKRAEKPGYKKAIVYLKKGEKITV